MCKEGNERTFRVCQRKPVCCAHDQKLCSTFEDVKAVWDDGEDLND